MILKLSKIWLIEIDYEMIKLLELVNKDDRKDYEYIKGFKKKVYIMIKYRGVFSR